MASAVPVSGGQTTADWPLSATDLAPYHEKVERLHQVTASPPARWTDLMAAAAQRLGWDPFPAPVATAPLIGRQSLAAAVRAGRLGVLTDTVALTLTVDPDGRVDGARVWHAGAERQLTARHVILAAHPYETVRLLLLSRTGADPHGLGNAQGQLGQHFATHSFVAAYGRFPGMDLDRAAGPFGHATAVADFDGDAIDPARDGFVGGSILQASMGAMPVPPEFAGPGTDAREVGRVWAQPEQLTRLEHRLDLDPDHRDALGRPVLRITHALADDDLRRAGSLQERLASWLEAAGARQVWRQPAVPQSISSHAYGGTRMGDDPRTSVVDGHGRLHGHPNLVVLGASTFPSTGGRGPTQTVEALAWRSCEALAGR